MENGPTVVDPNQIESVLSEEVGQMSPGSRLATERELMDRFNAPRSMIRKVLSSMESRFLISRELGSGTYVADRARIVIGNKIAPSFHSAVEAYGKQADTKLVESSRVRLPDLQAEMLGMRPGADTLLLDRIGYVDGLPATVVREWIVPDRLHDLDIALGVIESVFESLKAFGFTPARRRTVVTVTDAPSEVRTRLGQRGPAMCWLIITASEDAKSGQPLMVSETYMRMSLIDLHLDFR